MKRIYPFLFLLTLVCASCDTYVSTKAIERKMFTFRHAGKKVTLPVELQEIRTSKRRGGLFSGRKVSYTFVFAMLYEGKELVQLPCDEDASLDEFIGQLKIRRSADRKHFAIGKERETFAIFHSFNKKIFLGYAPLVNPEQSYDFVDTRLNSLPSPRAVLKDHLTGYRVLPAVSGNTLTDILCTLPPQDELNQEAIYMLTGARESMLGRSNEQRLISHCRASAAWRKKALAQLREYRQDQEMNDYLSRLYLLAGKEEVEKEDQRALKSFDKDRDISYFAARIAMQEPRLSGEVASRFREKLDQSLLNVCALSESQLRNIPAYLKLSESMGSRRIFERFAESYERSGCKTETIHDLNNALMFVSELRTHEKKLWVDLMMRNFRFVKPSDRSWEYDRIRGELTCAQQRELLLKYGKDIDTFGNMEIPECK